LIRLLLLALLALLPVRVAAEAVRLHTVEHADFMRLVMDFPERPEWSLRMAERRATIILPPGDWTVDAAAVFAEFSQTRIADVRGGGGGMELEFGCDCRVIAFEQGDTSLAIDVSNPGRNAVLHNVQATSSDGATGQAADAETAPAVLSAPPPPISYAGRVGDRAPPGPGPDGDSPQGRTAARALPSPPEPEQPPPPGGEPPRAAGSLLTELAKGIARATTQGALRLAPRSEEPPGAPPRGSAAPAAANLRLRLPGEEAWLPREAPPESDCPEDAAFDAAGWGPGDSGAAEAISALRLALSEDIDAVDEDTALQLARLYISLGFGAEARAVLDAMAPRHPETARLSAMAHLVDGEPAPRGSLDRLAECPGRAQLWVALATGTATESEAVMVAVSELPLALRRHVAPRLIDIFLSAGDAATAGAIRAAIDRAAGPHGAPFDLAAAQIDMEREAPASLRTIRELASDTTPSSDDALTVLLEVAHERGEAVDPASIALAETRADDLQGTPAGARLQTGLIRALLRMGDFGEAATRLTSDGVPAEATATLAAEFFSALSERGPDEAVLIHAAGLRDTLSGLVRDNTAGAALASRLLDLDLPLLARDYLPDVPADAATAALTARLHLQTGDPAAALAALDRIGGAEPDHLRLRADALRALGQWEDAQAIRATIDAEPASVETGGQQGAIPPPVNSDDSPGALVDASEEARQRIDALLATVPAP
jgi:hypothetical protein